MMEAFYQIIKGYEAYERFVFLTGITKLSQVSIFSKLNNLTDISRNIRFAGMVGYTGEELDQYFVEYWKNAAEARNCMVGQLKEKLEYWYDGFRFTFANISVFNPISIGSFINENYDFARRDIMSYAGDVRNTEIIGEIITRKLLDYTRNWNMTATIMDEM